MIEFPISGVETYWWLPILVSFLISSLTSTGGLSGAFLLLPFQMSVLGFTSPAVSATNLMYNIVAIPSGVARFYKEKRLVWPLVWIVVIGTLPGVFLGAIIRIKYLPNPKSFKLFVGFVLLYIGFRLMSNILKSTNVKNKNRKIFNQFYVKPIVFNLKKISYEFENKIHSAPTMVIFSLSLIVGIIGGIYGIGGGAIIAPFLVSVFQLPVYTVAGAALLSTFFTSIVGVLIYTFLASFYSTPLIIQPDWLLGILFGIGGALGIYTGARFQKYINEKIIKSILVICLLFVALKYISGFWFY